MRLWLAAPEVEEDADLGCTFYTELSDCVVEDVACLDEGPGLLQILMGPYMEITVTCSKSRSRRRKTS